jgi:hypothetical protein
VEKIHGIARAVHNSEKRAGYNLAHRAVSGFSAISELAHSLHQTEHGLFRVPSKKKSATRDFCEAPHLREIGQEG